MGMSELEYVMLTFFLLALLTPVLAAFPFVGVAIILLIIFAWPHQ